MANLLRPLLGLVVSLGVVFAAITYLALEGQEVAVLRSRSADGGVRETRVWVADHGGMPWIEAAEPEREFYADVLREPRVDLERAGRVGTYLARPLPGRAGHDEIRALLNAKYGLADWWVGQLVDTSRSIAIRLEPAADAGSSAAPGAAAAPDVSRASGPTRSGATGVAD
jgi:hypothetical protein